MWLTVPVFSRGERYQKIYKTRISNSENWAFKHWRSICFNYEKAPFFGEYRAFFEDLYRKEWNLLANLNEAIIRYLFAELKIRASIVKSSELKPEGAKTDLLIDMCSKLGADTFLSGIGGHSYVDERKFENQGLHHLYRDFHHPVYHQQFDPFIPCMSVIDLLFNYGSEQSREIISNCGHTETV
jgi:hypothetical protein